MSTHQQPCPCAYCRMDEINEELFDIPESKSPRLLWMERHDVITWPPLPGANPGDEDEWGNRLDQWMAALSKDRLGDKGYGDTEDEAITQLALKLGIRLWSEEGFKL